MSGFQDLTSEKINRLACEIVGRHRLREGNPNAPVDPYDVRQVREEHLRGRDRDHYDRWKQVMEHHGFVFLLPAELDQHPLVGPQKVVAGIGAVERHSDLQMEAGTIYRLRGHQEPQWRRFGRYAETFTPADLITLFGDSPEVFHAWLTDHTTRRMARERGIVVPSLVVGPRSGGNRAQRRAKASRARSSGVVIAKR
jgi:hypothetical protein